VQLTPIEELKRDRFSMLASRGPASQTNLAERLGCQMQRLARANLQTRSSKAPADPRVSDTISETDFLDDLRASIWNCLEQLTDSEDRNPGERLKALRRSASGNFTWLISAATLAQPKLLMVR
jgi:hypothetical protein